jgi:hypothetical protein
VSGQRGRHVTRPFLAGALGFRVQCDSAKLRDTVEALFADLTAPPPDMAIHELRLDEGEQNGITMLDLVGFGMFDPGPLPPDLTLDTLVSRVGRLSLDADPDRLHLHAAALAKGGRSVLVSASGGTGKSTLATALVLRGWDYLSDESVALTAGSTSITSFAKPLSIKVTGRDLFAHQVDLADRRVALGPSDGTWWNVPASRLGGRVVAAADPALLVFLSRTGTDSAADARPSWTTVHPADAVVLLVQESLDVGRFGESAVVVIAELAARCRCVRVEAGTPSDTAELVEQLLTTCAVSEHEPPLVLPTRAGTGYAPGVKVGDAVVSVLLADRVVVHDVHSGRIASFDEAGSAVWLALYGHELQEHALPDAASPGVRSFFHALEREEFVVLVDDEAVGARRSDVT